ncbi:phosphotransferase family protein [Maledivibacter halophilus]|uniref:Predicted kinase, aminoglycoside phosphotransferase (APT) family n=1 Tax=Maledivibacter halophilus TaxID=36842 RepID=A0A1T5MW46_9FIRM|nr:aminoglycoside phosphotransferase family protein [Maledivibacter halophilus]SKC92088.1 Predicted kinase, aminoglycoside phosphotransferase (APT) family [Maledivibacter halophilus]
MEKLIRKVIKIMKLKVRDMDSVPESYSSKVCSLVLENGEKVILKIPYNKKKLLKEYKMLKLLEGKLPTPRILDFWEGNDEISGALILSYIDGKPITNNIGNKIAYQMGELLARLHDINIERNELGKAYELIYTEEDKWWEIIREWFEGCIDDCKNILNTKLIDECIKLFDLYYKDLPKPDYPSIVHMDYRPGNILIKDSNIVGLLDFETVRIGSADVDFSKIKLFVWDLYPGSRKSFLLGYSNIRSLPDIERTLPFYQLFNTFTGVGWCVKRGKTNDSFCNQNIIKLEKIIKESRI